MPTYAQTERALAAMVADLVESARREAVMEGERKLAAVDADLKERLAYGDKQLDDERAKVRNLGAVVDGLNARVKELTRSLDHACEHVADLEPKLAKAEAEVSRWAKLWTEKWTEADLAGRRIKELEAKIAHLTKPTVSAYGLAEAQNRVIAELREQVKNLTAARSYDDERVREMAKKIEDQDAALKLRRDINMANIPENYLTLSSRIVELEAELAKTSEAELNRKQVRIDELDRTVRQQQKFINTRRGRERAILDFLSEAIAAAVDGCDAGDEAARVLENMRKA